MLRLRLAIPVLALLGILAPPASAARTSSVAVTAGTPAEFHFRFSRTAVRRGVVVFHVVNRGRLGHDFEIAGHRTRLLEPGQSARLRVVFRRPGRYVYRCTVPGYAEAGMRGVLRVR